MKVLWSSISFDKRLLDTEKLWLPQGLGTSGGIISRGITSNNLSSVSSISMIRAPSSHKRSSSPPRRRLDRIGVPHTLPPFRVIEQTNLRSKVGSDWHLDQLHHCGTVGQWQLAEEILADLRVERYRNINNTEKLNVSHFVSFANYIWLFVTMAVRCER